MLLFHILLSRWKLWGFQNQQLKNTMLSLYRFQKGEPSDQQKILFENVTREDADKSVSLLIKYLFNYGFYKFGIEMTLIMLVTLISFRKDTMSIVYIFWFCMICGVRRRTKKFIWPIFQYFVTIATITQYAIMLNLPSFLYPSEFQHKYNIYAEIACDFTLIFCFARRFSMGIQRYSELWSVDCNKGASIEAPVRFSVINVHLPSAECVQDRAEKPKTKISRRKQRVVSRWCWRYHLRSTANTNTRFFVSNKLARCSQVPSVLQLILGDTLSCFTDWNQQHQRILAWIFGIIIFILLHRLKLLHETDSNDIAMVEHVDHIQYLCDRNQIGYKFTTCDRWDIFIASNSRIGAWIFEWGELEISTIQNAQKKNV